MDIKQHLLAITAAAAFTALSACARTPTPDAQPAVAATSTPEAQPTARSAAPPALVTPVADPSLPLVTVHKNASCGCCVLWVEHMQAAGFRVEVRDIDNMEPVKSRLGVPAGKGSCHTAEVGGYFVEGHVPAEDIKRLLAQKPSGKGLVLPGMPMGSPGMEMPDGRTQPYTVELVQSDGSTVAFAEH
jgi:hypothetical protein